VTVPIYLPGLPEKSAGWRTPYANWESINARAIFRLDGFISADADYHGAELTTPPLVFAGRFLRLNLDTSAGGSARVEVQDASGQPLRGYSLKDADVLNGNSTRMQVSWGAKSDLGSLAGKPVRLRFVMRNCKLYAFQFAYRDREEMGRRHSARQPAGWRTAIQTSICPRARRARSVMAPLWAPGDSPALPSPRQALDQQSGQARLSHFRLHGGYVVGSSLDLNRFSL